MKINVQKTRIFLFLKLCSSLCVLALVLFFLHLYGYRINLTNSLPQRIFKICDAFDKTISRGDYVVVDYSLLKHNSAMKTELERYLAAYPMVKQVGAVSGDLVFLKDDRLYINSVDFSSMIVLSTDSLGNPLSPYPTPVMLRTEQYWLISDPEHGFDSRYFGLIERDCITHVAYPVF